MNAKINIWTLAFDTEEGLGCKLFNSEDALFSFLGGVMLKSMEGEVGEQAEILRAQIESGDFDSAYPSWSDHYRNELDSYSWDCCEFECAV